MWEGFIRQRGLVFAFFRNTRLEFFSRKGVYPNEFHNSVENPIGFVDGSSIKKNIVKSSDREVH